MAKPPEDSRSGRERWLFPRSHRLKRKRLIEPLFNRNDPSAHSVSAGTVRLMYRLAGIDEIDDDVSFQVGIAVGKSAGSAVERNRIKRIIREAIRLNQHLLHGLNIEPNVFLTTMIIFRGNDRTTSDIARDVVRCLEKLNGALD